MQPPVAHLPRRRLHVPPVPQEDHGIPFHPHRDLAVHESQLVPRVGAAHPAGSLRPGGAVPDQQVRLGLPVELVQPDPEPLPAPRRGLLADGLATARQRPQRDGHSPGPTHHPQRRRGHEDVADRRPGDHVERLLGVEPGRAKRDDGHPVGERRHDDVVEPADPGPVGRRPDPVARLREEVVRELEPGHVTGEHAMAVEGALGRACRPGGVDQEGRRVGGGRRGREVRRRVGEEPLEVVVDVDRHTVEAEGRNALERLPLAKNCLWL